MKKLLILLIFISGCASVTKPIQSPIQGSIYNSVYNRMFERPTSVEYEEIAGQIRLYIKVDEYGDSYSHVWFDKNRVSEYLSMLDKYNEWHTLAMIDSDVVEKEIGILKTAGGVKIKFLFLSANSKNHYLVMQGGALGQYSGGIALNHANVQHLRILLQQFASGSLKSTDNSKYTI